MFLRATSLLFSPSGLGEPPLRNLFVGEELRLWKEKGRHRWRGDGGDDATEGADSFSSFFVVSHPSALEDSAPSRRATTPVQDPSALFPSLLRTTVTTTCTSFLLCLSLPSFRSIVLFSSSMSSKLTFLLLKLFLS